MQQTVRTKAEDETVLRFYKLLERLEKSGVTFDFEKDPKESERRLVTMLAGGLVYEDLCVAREDVFCVLKWAGPRSIEHVRFAEEVSDLLDRCKEVCGSRT